jgi:hypothetical protein
LPSLDQDGPSGRRLLFLFCPLFGKTELRVKILIFLNCGFSEKELIPGIGRPSGRGRGRKKRAGQAFEGKPSHGR